MRLHLARLVLTGVLASLTTLAAAPRATACEFPFNPQYEFTTDASADTTPPTVSLASTAVVHEAGTPFVPPGGIVRSAATKYDLLYL